MSCFSVLIGGKAGDGIDRSSLIIAYILNELGYRLYIYRDYPSIIRGGHTFSIIRFAKEKKQTHKAKVNMILAMNQDCLDFHKDRLKDVSTLIYDPDVIDETTVPHRENIEVLTIPVSKIIKEEEALAIMRNSCMVGAMCKALGIEWDVLKKVFNKKMPKAIELNLKVARRGYDEAKEVQKTEVLEQKSLPILTGNEVVGLGLIKGGLESYIAYPMTPASTLLHFLASNAEDFSLKVIHPESEIGVILMALGCAYAGEKVALGTSGGGFCLMTEGFSLAGMAELPIVVMVSQRPGPSTGLPTYSSQTELHFALHAGQGEFARFVVAPGDLEEAYYWSQVSMNISWKYQTPSIILTDKNLCEGTYSFDIDSVDEVKEEEPLAWDGKGQYKRYLNTKDGVSPFAYVSDKKAIIKTNSYEHDEFGITTEKPGTSKMMQEKRLRKEEFLKKELKDHGPVKVYGEKNSKVAILCWGSNKGVCVEAGLKLNLKVIQPIVLAPFPLEEYKRAVTGVEKIICVENNATAQLVQLINQYGFDVDEKVLKYDGRPFVADELEEQLKSYLEELEDKR